MFGSIPLARGFLTRRTSFRNSAIIFSHRNLSAFTPEEQESSLRRYLEMYDGTKKSLEDVKPILYSVLSPDAVIVTPGGEVGLKQAEPTIAKLVEGGAKNTVHSLKQTKEGSWMYQVEVVPGDGADPMMVNALATFNSDGQVARVEPMSSETEEIYEKMQASNK